MTVDKLYNIDSANDIWDEWEKSVLNKFEDKMSDKEKPFPCIPATIGFALDHLRYGFIGDPRKSTTAYELANLLKAYTVSAREFGTYTSLIVFYKISEEMKHTYSVHDYEQLFWDQLSEVTKYDEYDWPVEIPTDPHQSIWEYCFHGERYFIYCATPAHKNRNSRHFDTLMLAITPRWVLEEFHVSKSSAAKIKKQIRKRLANYDTASIHPDLNSYGQADNYEWRQYFLRDDQTKLPKCPYHQ